MLVPRDFSFCRLRKQSHLKRDACSVTQEVKSVIQDVTCQWFDTLKRINLFSLSYYHADTAEIVLGFLNGPDSVFQQVCRWLRPLYVQLGNRLRLSDPGFES